MASFHFQTASRASVKTTWKERKSFPQPRLQRCCQTTGIQEAVLPVIWGDSSPHNAASWGLIKSQRNAPPQKKPWAGRQLNKDSVWDPVTADNKKQTKGCWVTDAAQKQVVTVQKCREVEDLCRHCKNYAHAHTQTQDLSFPCTTGAFICIMHRKWHFPPTCQKQRCLSACAFARAHLLRVCLFVKGGRRRRGGERERERDGEGP